MVFVNNTHYNLSGSDHPFLHNPATQHEPISETYDDLYLKTSSYFEGSPIPVTCGGFNICFGSRLTRSPSPLEREDDGSDMDSTFGEEFYVDGCNTSARCDSWSSDEPYMPTAVQAFPDAEMTKLPTKSKKDQNQETSKKNQEALPKQALPRTPMLASNSPTIACKTSAHKTKSNHGGDVNESEDEYMPPTKSGSTKKRVTRKKSSSLVTIPTAFCRQPTSTRKSTKQIRIRPPPRNEQATGEKLQLITEMLASRQKKTTHWYCQICNYKQKERWMDFERHVHTHIGAKDWWCKGVLLEDVAAFSGRIALDAVPYQFLGRQRIGGCEGHFSRRDALKRHLDNPNIPCIGWASKASQR